MSCAAEAHAIMFANDPKCVELGWICVPLAVETSGREAQETFCWLATLLVASCQQDLSRMAGESGDVMSIAADKPFSYLATRISAEHKWL